jgi:hypothetical protein
MTQRVRAVQAKWILRSACALWAIFVVVGVAFRLPYLRPPRWMATWELSLGTLGLLWVVTAAWSGSPYRGRYPLLLRARKPVAFWWQVGLITALAVVSIGVGAWQWRGR